MSILSTIKRGYLYLKSTSGYIKVLPRTEASLVELKDGTNVENRISNKAAYSYIKEVTTEEYHSQAGKEYNWESSSFTSVPKTVIFPFSFASSSVVLASSFKLSRSKA